MFLDIFLKILYLYINSDLAHGNHFALPGKCTPLLINILLVG